MAFTPKFGTDGRVKSGSTTVAGMTSWNVNGSTGEVNYTHFESSSNSDGIVAAQFAVGIAETTVDVEGIYDTDATTATEQGTPALRLGKTVTLDLVVDKTNSKGYDGVAGFIKSFTRGMQINNTAFTYKMQVRVTGTFPEYGTIS